MPILTKAKTMKKANKPELAKALSKALIMLATIHNDEIEECRRNCLADETIVSKQDLQDFEESWQQYSAHGDLMYEIPEFIKEWKS